jgi:hypothetical protein
VLFRSARGNAIPWSQPVGMSPMGQSAPLAISDRGGVRGYKEGQVV